MPLIVVWPLLTNLLAGVEEAGHGGANGSDATGEGGSWRGGIRHRQTVGTTVAMDSYPSYLDHNPQP